MSMTKDNLPSYTVCVTCNQELPDTKFYKARPDECCDCVDAERESKGYQGYGASWHEGFKLRGSYGF